MKGFRRDDDDALLARAARGDGDAFVEEMAAASYESELRAAVAALPPDQREAILAHVVDEQDYQAISERLVCSETVVRQRVSRGLRALRTQLKEVP